MRDINIQVHKNHTVDFENDYVGLNEENLQGTITFKFDEFVSGQARAEIVINNEDGYVVLEQENDTYTLPIKSSLLKGDSVLMQLVIDQEPIYNKTLDIEIDSKKIYYVKNGNSYSIVSDPVVEDIGNYYEAETPVWKSEIFYFKVGNSINAEIELPDDYPTWIEAVNGLITTLENNVSSLGDEIDTFDATKQDKLVSGTNIKTINGNSILGSGNISITVPTKTSDLTNDSNFVSNTNYATPSKAGVIKSGYNGLQVDGTNGKTYCDTYSYANYGNVENQRFISKGTLENVITGKGLINSSYHDSSKQDTLVSGTNIKTINNQSILGSGNIDIQGGGGSATDVQINGTSITSSGVANIITKTAYNSSTNKIATESDIPSLTDYVKNTDYATSIKGGVVKIGNNLSTMNGQVQATTRTYEQYQSDGNQTFVGKGTLENVITGKGLVKNTNYATSSVGGVVKSNNYFNALVSNEGLMYSVVNTYADYGTKDDKSFISKGTLENVITGKGLVDNTDYATQSATGVIKASANYQTNTTNTGELYAVVKSYADYSGMWTNAFISKGTLDNVITGKSLATTSDISAYHDSTKLDTSKVVSSTSTTSGEVYDVVYINTMLGNIETLLSEV